VYGVDNLTANSLKKSASKFYKIDNSLLLKWTFKISLLTEYLQSRLMIQFST
jgi:hypothetical protein